ncbi:MAG: ferric reductase-like transmembrane domain-containing protein [Pirellula sp.]
MNSLQFYRNLVLLNGAVPLVVLLWDAYRGQLGANPANNALHVTGILSLIFLLLSLSMTPARWITGWSGWIAFRRSLGLYGFFYSVLHFGIYVGFDRELNLASTVHEIWMRFYLQIGMLAVLLMVPLAITSTNSMIRKVGAKRWKTLHRLAYVVAILGVMHYYILVKSDVRQPVAFGVVLGSLLVCRVGYLRFQKQKTSGSHSDGNPQTIASKAFWTGELMLMDKIIETPSVQTFRFASVNGRAIPFVHQPGQYMNLRLVIDNAKVNRSYTIASSPTRRDYCEVTIKREAKGIASRYLHDNIQIGETLQISAPAGRFVFTGEESKAVLLMAGGVGITPMMSIVRYLTDRDWQGDIYLFIVARTEQDIIFREEIELLQQRHHQLHVCITLTRQEPTSNWRGERGRANVSMLKRFVPDVTCVPVYLCGPESMMDATKETLLSMGVPSSSIKTEAFVSPGVSSASPKFSSSAALSESSGSEDDSDAGSFAANFAISGKQITTSSQETLLESAEKFGIELPFECRSGICGQCTTRLLLGRVKMDSEVALSSSEKAEGYILACQARACSDVTIEA